MRSVLLSQLPDDGGERDSGISWPQRGVLIVPPRITRDRCSALDVAGSLGIYIAGRFRLHFQCARADSEPQLRRSHQKPRVSRFTGLVVGRFSPKQSNRAEVDFSAPVRTLHCPQHFVVLAKQVGGLAPYQSLARSPSYRPSHG